MPYDEHRIEDLKKKLYSPSTKVGEDIRRPLSQKNSGLSGAWSDDLSLRSEEDSEAIAQAFEKQHSSRFGVLIPLLIVSFIFFAGALAYAFFAINTNKSVISNNNIDISIVSPLSVGGGEVLPLEITITNNNSGPIEGADLIVEFPQGSRSADDVTLTNERFIKTIGSIAPGEVVRENVEAIVFGKENENAHIEVSLQYNAESSNAIFTKTEGIDIALSAPPIIATIEALEEVTAGQNLSFKVVLESNSARPLKDVIVLAKYPFGFSLTESSVKPFFSNRAWYIGDLQPREKYELTIDGVMQGQDNEERYFDFTVGIQDSEIKENIAVALGHVGHDVSIARPFLGMSIAFDRETDSTVVRNAGTTTTGEITVTNTTSNPIQNVQIVLNLKGEMLDKFTIAGKDGFYNSNTNTITWNSQTNEKLATLQPGVQEKLSFNFKIKPVLDMANFPLNPEIVFTANAQGNRPGETGVAETLQTSAVSKINVATAFVLKAEALYAAGPIKNSGPIPPKVGIPTTYTVRWSVSNTSNQMTEARLTTKLPPYIEWKNTTTPTSEKITYNPVTREVMWDIGTIAPRTGFGAPIRNVAFQIELTPSASQFEQEVILVESASFIGYDSFAEVNRESALEVLTTDTEDSADYRNGRVTQ